MRSRRPVYPRKIDVDMAIRALGLVPIDEPITTSWRNSHAGNPNLRVKAITKNVEWLVDVYPRNYFFVRVESHTQVCRSLPSLIGYICRMLGVLPRR